MLPVVKVSNEVTAYLAGTTLNEYLLEFKCNKNHFKAKENSITPFVSGFIFGIMYQRICFSKLPQETSRNIYHQRCLSLLMAAKNQDENQIFPKHRYVSNFDRGTLYKLNKDIAPLFSVTEAVLLS